MDGEIMDGEIMDGEIMDAKVGDKYRWLHNDGRYWLRDGIYNIISVDDNDIRMSSKDPDETYGIDISLINKFDFWQKVEPLEDISKETEVKFQVGDIVEFGGAEGKINEINKKFANPIFVKFEYGDGLNTTLTFTIDGKYTKEHTKPLLNFVRRPKKKVKKTVYVEISNTDNGFGDHWIFGNARTNNRSSTNDSYTVYPVEIEVEEED